MPWSASNGRHRCAFNHAAAEQAALVVREVAAGMGRASVVPDDDIAGPPMMLIRIGGVFGAGDRESHLSDRKALDVPVG